MTYIDSSSLLKIFWEEPESPAVRETVSREQQILVSSLTELETEVQLRARWLAGAIKKKRYDAYRTKLASLRDIHPFEFHELMSTIFRRAIDQHVSGKMRCRTLDRLHLAAMEELGSRRLVTNDSKQAIAARSLGFDVISPK
jgi:predicted nucleic acid-binding protein